MKKVPNLLRNKDGKLQVLLIKSAELQFEYQLNYWRFKMKKLILCLALTFITFQVNAATITLANTSNSSQYGSPYSYTKATGDAHGVSGGFAIGAALNDEWEFSTSEDVQGFIVSSILPIFSDLSITLFDGITELGVATIVGMDATFGGHLFTAGKTYTLKFAGIATNGGSYHVDITQTPVPAAVWLFGSALLGVAGISRSKSKKIIA